MACNRVRRAVFLWVDRDREQLPRGPMERHLEDCPHCREHASRIEAVIVMVRTRCYRRAAPTELQQRIRALLGLE
jgi:anti-sigma factor (TIGR02949 family)